MEEILASIRRILNEDDAAPATPADVSRPPVSFPPEPVTDEAASEDILVLDESMMVSTPVPETPPEPHDRPAAAMPSDTVPLAVMRMSVAPPSGADVAPKQEVHTSDTSSAAASSDRPAAELVAPETAAAAASSMGSLVRTLSGGRQVPVYSGGPTLEDMVRAELRTMLKTWMDTQLPAVVDQLVRAELRPMLKAWLDLNLPPMVDAVVRAEIEKVVGQAAS